MRESSGCCGHMASAVHVNMVRQDAAGCGRPDDAQAQESTAQPPLTLPICAVPREFSRRGCAGLTLACR
jgi:hypothetical protein